MAVFINEIHYDNTGPDDGEFIEIAGPAGTNLSEWTIVLYNGSNGGSYNTVGLSGVLADDTSTGFGFLEVPILGIQNGSPDGIALVDDTGAVVEFLSYEGVMTAVDGPATGMTSTDIGVSEPGTTPIGFSLQLAGTGDTAADFTWQPAGAATPGSANTGQSLTGVLPPLSIVETDGSTDVEEGGATDTISLVINTPPTSFASVLISTDGQVASAVAVSINPSASGVVSIPVFAVDDAQDEADVHTGTISFEVVSDDPAYNGLILPSVTVNVTDNDEPPMVKIHEIQGAGEVSGLVGQTVTVQAVVTGDFQDGFGTNGDLNGFYIQEELADFDADPLTSEGIFVFQGSNPSVDYSIGDVLEITGTVSEFFGETQISSVSNITVISNGDLALTAPQSIDLPSVGVKLNADGDYIGDLEAYEGMWVNFPDTLSVTELFNYDRFGEMRLSEGGRLDQFTQESDPDVAGFDQHLQENAARTIMLDDGSTFQNPNPLIYPDGMLEAGDVLRMGDTVTDLTGVVRFGRGSGGSGDETYRINPTEAPTFVQVNERPVGPEDVGGSLKVASFNVLNFFTTLDLPGNTTGPGGTFDPRGADNPEEYARQLEKLVSAISATDADVLGLVELENNFAEDSAAVAALVEAINASGQTTRTYDWVRPGTQFVGGDAIAVGMIYDVATVGLVGDAAILDDPSFLDPNNTGQGRNRAALAQTFEELGTGGEVTVVANHFKSKGFSGATGDDVAQGDGQGNWNDTRTKAAEALQVWIDGDPTGTGEKDVLLLGDFNAYEKEDPIKALLAGADGIAGTADDFADLGEIFDPDASSFVFDGQQGTLDYAIASGSLFGQVAGASVWQINSAEPDAFDYNLDFGRSPALFSGDEFRSSDHDPIIVGLNLKPENDAPVLADFGMPSVRQFALPGTLVLDVDATDENGDLLNYSISGGNEDGIFAIDAATGEITVADTFALTGAVPSYSLEITVRDTEGATDVAVAEITVDKLNVVEGGSGVLTGTALEDLILGNDRSNVINALGSDDVVFAGGKNDVVRAGSGADIVFGEDGNDRLLGGNGNDLLFGGAGRDNIVGGLGDDIINGGAGNDRLRGGEGGDHFVFDTPDFGNDRIFDFDVTVDSLEFYEGASIELVSRGRNTDIVVDESSVRVLGVLEDDLAGLLGLDADLIL